MKVQRLPGGHRLALALEVERDRLAITDHVAGGFVDALAHHDGAGIGGALKTGGGVDRVAGEHSVARTGRPLDVDEHLAGIDSDPHQELGPA